MIISTASSTRWRNWSSDVNSPSRYGGPRSSSMPVILAAKVYTKINELTLQSHIWSIKNERQCVHIYTKNRRMTRVLSLQVTLISNFKSYEQRCQNCGMTLAFKTILSRYVTPYHDCPMGHMWVSMCTWPKSKIVLHASQNIQLCATFNLPYKGFM